MNRYAAAGQIAKFATVVIEVSAEASPNTCVSELLFVKCDQISVSAGPMMETGGELMRMRIVFAMLLVLAATLARGSSSADPALTPLMIVQKMERAQAAVSIASHVKRDYRLSRGSSTTVDSEVIAEIDFRPPGKYVVEKRSGNSMGALVVKRILEHEVGVAVSSQKSRSAAITRENYLFSYLGEAVLDGQSYYLLGINPRRKQAELIVGQMWVDKQSFLIRRLEGTAQSPSMWVKKIHVRFDFDCPRGIWTLSNMEAVAEVRFLGDRKLTSSAMNDEASVAAEKIGTVAPIASVLLPK